ncbi:MAG TPA: response regulator [Planctomycetota bacterium]|nr:response regulator [Planctomycetota bacterium]
MDSELAQVSGLAVWGSLSATLILGIFFFVQMFVDRTRRGRFGLFGLVMMYLVALDLIRSRTGIDPLAYEWLRLWWGGAYAGCALWLLGNSPRTSLGVTAFLWLVGQACFRWGNPSFATTLMFPLAWAATGAAFCRKYLASRGYASAILCAYSIALGVLCSLYFGVVAHGVMAGILFGYLHFAIASVISVLFGWIHLPRELQGLSPVRTRPALAGLFVASVVASEGVIDASLYHYQEWGPELLLAGSLVQVAATLALYLHHRHQLVIHTDNVSQLLEERTVELRRAREELAGQNDLLARKLAEQERDLKAKGEVIDRQRRLELAAQTAGQVAHDMQNLLSPVLGTVEEIEDAGSLQEARERSASIRRQIQQLLEVNTHLLALSRRGRPESQAVRLADLARDVAQRFPGQRLTLESQGDAWIRGSWAQMTRALSNLVTNAIESDLDRGVPVTIRTGLVEVARSRSCHLGFLDAGRHAFVEVLDLGPGISAGALDKIFDPFFSTKGGRTQRSGTGLGLSIVAAVVDDHKGVVDLETGASGTRFILYFPPYEASGHSSDLPRLSHSATVLVVDDDTSLLQEFGPFLREAGWTVLEAGSGAAAIRAVQAQKVDVILLDFNMPRMNGLEAFLGAMHLQPGVRAVVHSSYLTDEQSLKLRTLGASSILLKPAGRREVLNALRDALDEKAAAGERL